MGSAVVVVDAAAVGVVGSTAGFGATAPPKEIINQL